MKRKVEEFVTHDAAGGAYTLVVWQHYQSAATRGNLHATVDMQRELRTVDARYVRQVNDEEFVILDPLFPDGIAVRRQR